MPNYICPILGTWHSFKHGIKLMYREFEHVCTSYIFKVVFPDSNFYNEPSYISNTILHFMIMLYAWSEIRNDVFDEFALMKERTGDNSCQRCNSRHPQSIHYMRLRSMIDLMEIYVPTVRPCHMSTHIAYYFSIQSKSSFSHRTTFLTQRYAQVFDYGVSLKMNDFHTTQLLQDRLLSIFLTLPESCDYGRGTIMNRIVLRHHQDIDSPIWKSLSGPNRGSLTNEESGEMYLSILGRGTTASNMREFEYANKFFKILPHFWGLAKSFRVQFESDIHCGRRMQLKADAVSIRRCRAAFIRLSQECEEKDRVHPGSGICMDCEAEEKREAKQKLSAALKKLPRYPMDLYFKKSKAKARLEYLLSQLQDIGEKNWAWDFAKQVWPDGAGEDEKVDLADDASDMSEASEPAVRVRPQTSTEIYTPHT